MFPVELRSRKSAVTLKSRCRSRRVRVCLFALATFAGLWYKRKEGREKVIPLKETMWVDGPQHISSSAVEIGIVVVPHSRVCPREETLINLRLSLVVVLEGRGCDYADIESFVWDEGDNETMGTKVREPRMSALHNAFVLCISCSVLQQEVVRHFAHSVVRVSYTDFQQMVWLTALNNQELATWHAATFDLTIVTTCRMATLTTLLEQIANTHYFGDIVNLKFAIEAGASVECLDLIDDFEWLHGQKSVQYRLRSSGGPHVAVPEAVEFTSTTKFHIMLEDDVGVSSQYYAWLKYVSLQLLGCKKCESKYRLFSISLYMPRVVETSNLPRQGFRNREIGISPGTVFLYEVPCSWGVAFSSRLWRRAFKYFELRSKMFSVYGRLPNSRVNGWKGSWKKWLVELGYWEHWKTLYVYFDGEQCFSTNKLATGAHIATASEEMIRNYSVPLFHDYSWFTALKNKRLFEKELIALNLHNSVVKADW